MDLSGLAVSTMAVWAQKPPFSGLPCPAGANIIGKIETAASLQSFLAHPVHNISRMSPTLGEKKEIFFRCSKQPLAHISL
jgi:hypothetical protein